MQPPSVPSVLAAGALAVPLALVFSRLFFESSVAWGVKLLLTGLLTVSILLLAKFAWRLISAYRTKRKTKKEQLEKKARLWNKLNSLSGPVANSKTLCLEEYEDLKNRMQSGALAPIDVLEAFQARTLMLDQKGKAAKVKEVVYDADVQALMLEGGRASEVLLPAAAFYYNAALMPFEDKDEDGDPCQKDHPVVAALRSEGAIDIALVDKDLTQVSGLLLNHGALFFAGQYSTCNLGQVLRAIASKPICATLLRRDQPDGKFLAILASQSRLPSLAAAAVTPGLRDHLLTPPSSPSGSQPPSPRRIGFLFEHQRRSQADGRLPPGEDSVAQLLSPASGSATLVRDVDFARLLSASKSANSKSEVRVAAEAILAENSLDGIALVAGQDCRLAEQLAGFMDLSVFHLTEQLAELYLCHPHDRLRSGLTIAQAFGSAIRL
uniref:Transmembrane protein n=2 Tax=Macrostomum lignano TaxID=282301 RepID=A0A1I8HAV5_9PLAT